jgi:hypothetical protein
MPDQTATAATQARSKNRKVTIDDVQAAGILVAEAVEQKALLDEETNDVVQKTAALYVKISQQIADGNPDISSQALAALMGAADLIETRLDSAVAELKKYAHDKVDGLREEVKVSLVEVVKETMARDEKTNERIDTVDAFAKNTDARLTAAQRVPTRAYVLGVISAVITFILWVSFVRLQQDVKLPDGTNLNFVYEPFNGPLGGIIAALVVFALVAFIGSHFKYERPLPSEPKVMKAKVSKKEDSKAIEAKEPKALETSSATDTTSKE